MDLAQDLQVQDLPQSSEYCVFSDSSAICHFLVYHIAYLATVLQSDHFKSISAGEVSLPCLRPFQSDIDRERDYSTLLGRFRVAPHSTHHNPISKKAQNAGGSYDPVISIEREVGRENDMYVYTLR